jgi:hypothetical protein
MSASPRRSVTRSSERRGVWPTPRLFYATRIIHPKIVKPHLNTRGLSLPLAMWFTDLILALIVVGAIVLALTVDVAALIGWLRRLRS